MIEHIAIFLFHQFKTIGIWGAFLSMFIENLGIPLPTEIGYLISQELLNTNIHSYFFVLMILTFGHVAGATISYQIGKMGDSYVTKKIQASAKISQIHEKLRLWYKKYGNLTVFLTRFVGYVRPWSSYVAGFAEVPFWPFLIWTTIGSLIFNVICLYFTGIIMLFWRRFAIYHTAIVIVALAAFFGFLLYELIIFLFSQKKHR